MSVLDKWCDSLREYGCLVAACYKDADALGGQVIAEMQAAGEPIDVEEVDRRLAAAIESSRSRPS